MGAAPPVGDGNRHLGEDHPVVHILVHQIVVEVPGTDPDGRKPLAALHAGPVALRLDVLLGKQVLGPVVERLLHRDVIRRRITRLTVFGGLDVERLPVGPDMLSQKHPHHLEPVFGRQPL